MTEAVHCNQGKYCLLHDCSCPCRGCLPHSDPSAFENIELREQVESLKKDLASMHRRAQRLEGIEAHMETLREKHRKALGDIFNRARRTEDLWFSRYREAVEVIRTAKVDDRIHGHDNHRTGSLIELLRRLIAERDDARDLLRGVEKLYYECDENFSGREWVELMNKIQSHREKVLK